MPSRKRSNLGRKSTVSRKMRKVRSSETNAQRDSRLAAARAHHSLSRAGETEEQRGARLSSDRAQHTQARESETYTHRDGRLAADRAHHNLSRVAETEEQRGARLSSDRAQHTQARESETYTHRDCRLAADRAHHNLSRVAETEEQRGTRLSSDRAQHTQARESETYTHRDGRLAADRAHHNLSRVAETEEQRDARLSSDRAQHTQARESETYTHRDGRLAADRAHHNLSRAGETVEQRYGRLSSDRAQLTQARESETYTHRDCRLAADRAHHSLSRAAETEEQRDARLSSDRSQHTQAREFETYTHRDCRLSADRAHHSLSRAAETEEQRDGRLSSDRAQHTQARESETYTHRDCRLAADRAHHSLSRAAETEEQRDARLSSDRSQHTQARESETYTHRDCRLSADRAHHSLSRAAETEEQRDARLELARNYYSLRRKGKKDLLSSERERIASIRSQETSEDRDLRLSSDRDHHRITRELVLDDEDESDRQGREMQIWSHKERGAFLYNPTLKYDQYANIEDMSVSCNFCKALKWKKESVGFCCSSGKVRLNAEFDPPELLKSLLSGEHPLSSHFLDSVRSYNSAFQMTSFGAKEVSEGGFMPTFKVQGQVYHLIGSLLPEDEPKFLQIYFISDYNKQACIRKQHFPNLNSDLITELQHMLHTVNPYIHSFKAAIESVPQGDNNNYKFIISADRRPSTEHRGRYNTPTSDEVAAVLVDQECDRRDIVLRARDNSLHRICETHRSYDALQYPLIYCHGEDGYNFSVYNIDATTGAPNYNKKTSALQFYCYLLQLRQNTYIYLQRFRGLFNQFIVDMYAKIETERLVYIRTNQKTLRAENYVHLRDAMQQDDNSEHLGRLVILPSSFTGGPRYMHERTQDALCYVRKYGRPDLFITFTTNPKWNEITRQLLPGQASYDRHDIIGRVFHLKLKIMVNMLTKENIFGAALCFMYTVEWQKRGLPHAHILLWLKDKIRPNDIDSVVCAEFPNPNEDPILYNIVRTHMVHGPCGALHNTSPCMQDGRCTKRYPRAQVEQTVTGEDGYPLYRRRSPRKGGFSAEVRVRGKMVLVDNSWVVPYSPILCKTFLAHINVEICNSVQSIKYICKYVNKGSDKATFGLKKTDYDEVTKFQSGRYISSSEAIWRIYSFPIHERYPPVMHLDVHVEGGQRIYFDPTNIQEKLENPRRTTLMAFFQLCETDEFAKSLLYDDIPSYYTYNKQRGIFIRRKRGTAVEGVPGLFKEHVLGRVFTVHPQNSECYYLRMLLHTVRGPTSFEALKVVDDVQHPTYQAACRARNLLDDDKHWDDTLAEACVSEHPERLRNLFSIMLVFCGLTDAAQLWQKYKDFLTEDFFHNIRRNHDDVVDEMRDSLLNRCLVAIEDIVTSIGGNPLPHYGLPEPRVQGERGNVEYTAETNYNPSELAEFLRDGVASLNSEQRQIFDRTCHSVTHSLGELIFLDSPGGTGKTFVTKTILAHVRQQGKIALAVASSGIAATLLPGGKTAHTTFKILIDLDSHESPVCNISRSSDKAKVLRNCSLIIWDECTMAHRKAVEAVDRTLRDIRKNDRPMGGITVLFCGDFRQTLPVVPRGTRADEINACLKSSCLWPTVSRVHLTINMRARIGGSANANEFSDLLLKIGEGRYPEKNGKIRLPCNVCKFVSSLEELIISVYGEPWQLSNHENSWLCERAILTPRNDQAAAINAKMLEYIDDDCVEYTSINRVVEEGDTVNYPVEFLESLTAPGLPSHKIKLKVGVPIILLRNISLPKLCNGTRLKVTALQRNVIEAEVLSGCGTGERVFIPRIPLIPNSYPFRFKRVQFPVSLCFAMTINKAQGQTLSSAGVDLSLSCFSHGQLYVALSRVTNPNNLFVHAPGKITSNIVYQEAL